MNIKTVPEKASWEPRPDCALLLLLKPENTEYNNRSCPIKCAALNSFRYLNLLDLQNCVPGF